jgi:Yip1 domain
MIQAGKVFVSRVIRAARLESSVYEEVESDRSAMGQSVAVIFLAGVATGIAAISMGDLVGLLNAVLLSLMAWLLCGLAAWIVGTRLLAEAQTDANFTEVLRVTGFSSAPGVLRVFGVTPRLGELVFLVTGIWMLVAMVIAIRQALDYRSTWRALVVAIIAWAFLVSVSFLALAFDS